MGISRPRVSQVITRLLGASKFVKDKPIRNDKYQYVNNGIGKKMNNNNLNVHKHLSTNVQEVRLFPCLYEDVRTPGESIGETAITYTPRFPYFRFVRE